MPRTTRAAGSYRGAILVLVQLWSSRHHHTDLVALSITVEQGHPSRPRGLPKLARVVDAHVAEVAETLARSDAAAARANGRGVRIDLDELVARAERMVTAESDDPRS